MTRIAIDARSLTLKQRGIPLYVFMICKRIPLHFPNSHFYFFINKKFIHNEPESRYITRLKELSLLKNVTIINAESEGEIFWELFILPKLIKKYKIKMIHMPANRVCMLTKISQVVTFHDIMEWKSLSLFKNLSKINSFIYILFIFFKRIYIYINYRFGPYKANNVLTISKYSKNEILNRLPKLSNKISFTYHGVPDTFYNIRHIKPIHERHGILMLGGDSKHKNSENAILAWSLVPPKLRKLHPLTIIGFTGNEDSPLYRKILECKLVDEIIIKNWISDEEILYFFKKSYCFFYPSIEEGFGFPLLQAMSCGTPTVCSTAEVLIEIGNKSILPASSSSPDDLAFSLEMIINDKKKWHELHYNSLKNSTLFDWNKTINHIAYIYKKTFSQKKSENI